jgi:succinate dehydrogenase / fumarate reductase, cytochrome b subunit
MCCFVSSTVSIIIQPSTPPQGGVRPAGFALRLYKSGPNAALRRHGILVRWVERRFFPSLPTIGLRRTGERRSENLNQPHTPLARPGLREYVIRRNEKQIKNKFMSTGNRPLSPHLQVYRWQITMLLSILHRATGFGLAAGALLVTWWLMSAAMGEAAFLNFHDFAGSVIGRLMMFGWIWAYVFHFLNGIRHLVWDAGRGFAVKTAALSAWVVLLLSFAGAALVWCMAGGSFS